MEVELDNEIYELIDNYQNWGGDESAVFHLANYFIELLEEQHPELFNN